MTGDLGEITAILKAFRDGRVTPAQFAERYSPLWKELVREQDAAIAAHPSVGPALPKLREMESTGEITTDEYLRRVQDEYARLQGLRVVPGTATAQALDQVFVEADAYGQSTRSGQVLVTEAELQEAVQQALNTLA